MKTFLVLLGLILSFGAQNVLADNSMDNSPAEPPLAIKNLYYYCYIDFKKPKGFVPLAESHPEVSITELDMSGVKIPIASYLPNPNGENIIVYAHGNGMYLEDMGHIFEVAKQNQLNVVVFDYPCDPTNGVVPNQNVVTDVALTVIKKARELMPDAKLKLWGRSLGAAVTLQALEHTDEQIDSVVLVSPWDSFRNNCRQIAPVGTKWVFCSKDKLKDHQFDSVVAGLGVDVPTLVIYTDSDKMVRPKLTKRLIRAIPEEFISVYKAQNQSGHNKVYSDASVFEKIVEFFN